MGDLISRSALIERLNEQIDGVLANRDVYTDADDVVDSVFSIIDIIETMPSAPTVEPPKGEWMVCEDLVADATVVKCSACRATDFVSNHVLLEVTDVKMHNFCPNCGADMRKKE